MKYDELLRDLMDNEAQFVRQLNLILKVCFLDSVILSGVWKLRVDHQNCYSFGNLMCVCVLF